MRIPLFPLFLFATLGCGDQGTIIDDWGPPAGYGAIQGVVRDTAGAVKPGALVRATLCTQPVGGFMGEATSGPDGSYRITASLPPVGLLPAVDPDTVSATCSIGAGTANATPVQVDTLTVHFAATPEEVVPITHDLTFR